jgi:hypothetical protein
MATTNIRGAQILNNTVQRQDLDTSTVGQAVITKIVQGIGVSLSSTGADSGTGDVTVSAGSVVSADAGNQSKLGSDNLIYTPGGVNGFISKTAAYTLTLADRNKYIICSGGSWTLTLPAAQNGLCFNVRNDMGISGTTGTITLQPAAGTINGAASLPLLAQQECLIISDGTNWRTFGLKREVILGTQDIVSSTPNGVVLLPAGYRMFVLEWSDLLSVTDAQNLQAYFSVNGGASFVNTGYYWTFGYNTSATAWAVGNAASTNYAFLGPPMNNLQAYGQCSLKLHPGINGTVPNYLAESGDFYNAAGIAQRFVAYGFMTTVGPVNALWYSATSGNIANSFLTVKGIV